MLGIGQFVPGGGQICLGCLLTVDARQRLPGGDCRAFLNRHSHQQPAGGHGDGRPFRRYDHARGRDHRLEGCLIARFQGGRGLRTCAAREQQAEQG